MWDHIIFLHIFKSRGRWVNYAKPLPIFKQLIGTPWHPFLISHFTFSYFPIYTIIYLLFIKFTKYTRELLTWCENSLNNWDVEWDYMPWVFSNQTAMFLFTKETKLGEIIKLCTKTYLHAPCIITQKQHGHRLAWSSSLSTFITAMIGVLYWE